MATSPTYCTARDIKDVFPNMDKYDDKIPLYGWKAHDSISNVYVLYNTGKITNLFQDGQEMTNVANSIDWTSANNGEWTYYESSDRIEFKHSSNSPIDTLMESGEDYNTLITRYISNASRFFDSRVDAGIPRDMFKNRKGEYDYMIVRTTALLASYFLSQAKEPGGDLAQTFLDEANFNIDQINNGKSKLSYQVTSDSSSGLIREVVSPQAANPLRIVDTKGMYSGSYDLLKIVISTAGKIGVAKFDVFAGDESGLKSNKIVDGEIISGKYQSVGNGLQIRFSGADDDAVATLGGTPDEWEIEVWGYQESMDGSPGSGRNTQMTRKSNHTYYTKL
tara:strand:- start:36635 stop:37639 length:1005 start_codon:yes stop_codon:yes gene_type:complete